MAIKQRLATGRQHPITYDAYDTHDTYDTCGTSDAYDTSTNMSF